MRKATAELDFRLVYQAQVNLLTGQVTGFEALLRWRHPVWGDVPPGSFIPVAERVGLIGRIGTWALEQACAEAAGWPARIGVAVNVSATQLGPEFLSTVLAALAAAGLAPQRLELEVSETALMPAGEAGVAVLEKLRAAGVRIAIDDFDVGYAPFSYLISFPFDRIKIDGSLVAHLGTAHARARAASAVIRSVCMLCRELGVSCSAEGIETRPQLEALMEAGCTDAQGFLLAAPVEGSGIAGLLRKLDGEALPIIKARPVEPRGFPLAQIMENARDIIIVTDATVEPPGPHIVYVNPAFTRFTGFTAAEAIGRSPRMLQGPGTSRTALDNIRAALCTGQPVHEKLLNYAKSGAPYWLDLRIFALRDDAGTITHFAAIERDVTMDKLRADELAELADRDTLTGIPNQRALLRGMEMEIAAAQARLMAGTRSEGPAVALIDIDNFNHVNDMFGHQTGDAVLYGLADRLAGSIRRADLLGRIGGEEFAICMPHVSLAEAVKLAETIRMAVSGGPFDTPNGPVRVTVSIGVAALTSGEAVRDLMKEAGLALRLAKLSGRNNVRHDAHVSAC